MEVFLQQTLFFTVVYKGILQNGSLIIEGLQAITC